MAEVDLDDLRAELEEFAQPQKLGGRSPREERIIAGFEEIQRFVTQHGRLPQHGEGLDIFERLYAVRLDRLREQEECRSLLAPLDTQGLLTAAPAAVPVPAETLDDDELLAELKGAAGAGDIMDLRHVRTSAEKRAAEEIANRTVCADFETFKPVFERMKRELKDGIRKILPIETRTLDQIRKGAFFVVEGQTAYIADSGDEFTTRYDRRDSRLRVIYDNSTESSVLQRSLQRALHRDPTARYVTDPDAGPLFAATVEPEDLASGKIYVVRSKSNLPDVAAHREVLHKIGVTGGSVETRVSNARLDPTFLLAEVEVVATYELYNINRVKLENLIHRVFDPARLDIELKDRFGNPYRPREWFLVPLFVIDEAVERIKDGSITDYVYNPKTAKLAKMS